MKTQISVIVPIKNEASNLQRCLKSVQWAAQIIVIDSASTDGSSKIAEAFGCEIVQFEFNGTWPKKKNWALENIPFANEWVLVLDADEVLPPEAEIEISAITQAVDSPIVGYWINRRFMFMGKWLRHAYYPNWNMRLFKHSCGRYEKLTESATSSGDNEVHEHVVISGPTGRLAFEMDHYAYPTINTFVEKHNRYSNWEARVALDSRLSGSNASLQAVDVGLRRKLKIASHTLPFRPLLRFLYVYIWQHGFLDGKRGYYFARLHAVYEFLCVVKTYEANMGVRENGGAE